MHNQSTMISFRTRKNSIKMKCEINLQELLPANERQRFDDNWRDFRKSPPCNKRIYPHDSKGDKLTYFSEQLIPVKENNRPSLLFVLGNPASHSVDAGMFFSFEADGREHRFWKDILRPALYLPIDNNLSVQKRNAERRKQLLNLNYGPQIRIGLCVFISMPSAASGPWSGVAGIQKLIGAKALERLEKKESKRVILCAKEFISSGGAVVAFQKNAWDALKADKNPSYSLKLAMKGKLVGTLKDLPQVPFFCVPPTRYAKAASQVLHKIVSKFLQTQQS